MKHISDNVYVLEWQDGDLSIGQNTSTGTHEGEIYLTPTEQKALMEYLMKKFNKEIIQ